MRFLLFALHAARGPAPPRTVLKATTNHYELAARAVPGARARRSRFRGGEARAPDFNAVNAATALQRLATAKLRRGERARGAAAAGERRRRRSPRTTFQADPLPWRRRAGRSRSSA